jgi:GntR family transcriptional repressor for pyruvate dehydrogenase complex
MMTRRQRSTLVADITHELREMVLTGKVQPGEFLPPRKDLAAQFGVGLSTVHEAIQALTAVGMVESHPGKGTWVRHDALDTLIHPAVVNTRLGELNAGKVYEARSVIEIALTEFAAQRATPEDIERIWDALEAMEAAVENERAFVEADLEFHLAVAKAGHNDLLEQFYHLTRKLLSEVITEMVRLPKVKDESICLQKAIAEAIEQRDLHKAREAALNHWVYIGHVLDGVTEPE